MKQLAFLFILFLSVLACKEKAKDVDTTDVSDETQIEKRTRVEMSTTKGIMTLELYNETPLHRDNFVKLTKEKAFDSLLFHRVINKFMVQAGDPDSRLATATDTLGEGDLPYTVPAEINTAAFHKKGALGAARDGNLARASSAMQFYIVQGKPQNDSLLEVNQRRINDWLQEHYFKNKEENKTLVDAMQTALENDEYNTYKKLNDSIMILSKGYEGFDRYTIPENHVEVYKSLGGTPHLDQNYTVFGEVTQGLRIIDSIATSATNPLDRPENDIRILSVRVIED